MAFTLWTLGYPSQALRWSQRALTLAEEVAHPFSLAYVLFLIAFLHSLRREDQSAYDCAEAVLALSTAHGFPIWILLGTFIRGCALAMLGQGEEGIAQMRQHQEAWRATVMGPIYLLLLAETYAKAGQPEAGVMVLAEAHDVIEASGHRFWEAEAYRLHSEFLLARSDANALEAEKCFHQALTIAHRQQAKAWELRAAMSLSRLWQRQGKHAEARQRLAPIYGWFTEGFDTADLQEAKAVPEELRA